MKQKDLVMETILTRRSVRSFTDQQVSKSDLDIILQAALYAPTGRNSQMWRFTVIQDKEKLLALNDVVKKIQKSTDDYNFYYNAPTLILVSHIKDSPLAPYDCACALENIFLAAHALDIGSCWINQIAQNTDEPEIRNILDSFCIPSNYNVYGSAALGFTALKPESVPRRSGIIHWI